MSKDQPLISVIIPVYNVEKYLPECLDKTLGQSFHNIEILCIDDCSTDNSLKILNKYSSKDGRMKIYQMEKNSGSGPARNVGLEKATGEYLAFMDPDDYYYDEYCLESLYTSAINNNVSLCRGTMIRFDSESNKLMPAPCMNVDDNILMYPYEIQEYCGYTRYIFKHSFIKKNNIIFPVYRRFQDPVFMIKALTVCDKVFGINKVVYVHRKKHKKIIWNLEKASDLMNGIIDILNILSKNNYWKGYMRAIEELRRIRYDIPCKILLNRRFFKLFFKAVNRVHIDKIPAKYQQELLESLRFPRFYFIEPRLVRIIAPVLKLKNIFFPQLKLKRIMEYIIKGK